MTRADFTERAARHAVRLFNRASGSDDWDEREEPAKQCWRADIFELLDESGYPAALDEATRLLWALLPFVPIGTDVYKRARQWLADHDEQTT